jgi:hypothetical protein
MTGAERQAQREAIKAVATEHLLNTADRLFRPTRQTRRAGERSAEKRFAQFRRG